MDPKTVPLTGIFLMLLMAEVANMTELNDEGRALYHFIKTPKTWREAQSYCRENFADMVTVDNMAEHKRLKEITGNSEFTWIGLERSPPKRWVWTDGAGNVTVFKWNPKKSDCGTMKYTGYWQARPCDEKIASLCYYRDSNGKKLYNFNREQLSWQDALSYCRKHFIDLVSVKTRVQNILILSAAKRKTFWMGLVRDDYVWSDGSSTTFRNWHKSNPDNQGGNENCVAMRNSYQQQWDDTPCETSLPFICYGHPKKTYTIVVKVKTNSGANLNLSLLSDSLMKQLQVQLEEMGLYEAKIKGGIYKT